MTAPLKPGDVVVGPCQPVGNLPPKQLTLVNGRLAEIAGTGATAKGKLFLASRKAEIIANFAAQGLTICDDSTHHFAKLQTCLRLNLGPAQGAKIITAGYHTVGGDLVFAVTRWNNDGTLDTTFGTGGHALTSFGAGTQAQAFGVTVLPNRNIVAVGSSTTSSIAMVLALYDPNGMLLNTATVDFAGDLDVEGRTVTIKPDGSIVVAGFDSEDGSDYDMALFFFDSSGSSTGTDIVDFGTSVDQGFGIAVRPDGSIVAVGKTFTDDTQFDFAIYDGGTQTVVDFSGMAYDTSNDTANAAGILVGGASVAVGSTADTSSANAEFAIAIAGVATTTTSFGSNNDDEAFGVAVQTDGKFVVVGRSLDLDTSIISYAIARYSAGGGLDGSFGSGGQVLMQFPTSADDEAFGVVIQGDGKIVVAGLSNPSLVLHPSLARYNTDGTLDTTFGTGGLVVDLAIAGPAFAVALQPA